MKTLNKILLTAIFSFAFTQLFAQIDLTKISFGNFPIHVEYWQYPSKPLGDGYSSYSFKLDAPEKINPKLLAFFERNITIKGFQPIPDNGDLIVKIHIKSFDFAEPVVGTNKVGEHTLSMQYSYDCVLQLLNAKTNKSLGSYDINTGKNIRGNVGFKVWNERYDVKSKLDHALNTINKIQNELIESTFTDECKKASEDWTRWYGKELKSNNDGLLVMDEKNYYYSYFYLHNVWRLKEIFKKTNINKPPVQYKDEIAPFIQYYEDVILHFQKIQPKVANKVAAASYYNIAKIYYYYDMPDQMQEYIDKGFATGEMGSYFQGLTTSRKYLLEIFEKNKITSRYNM